MLMYFTVSIKKLQMSLNEHTNNVFMVQTQLLSIAFDGLIL